MQKTWCFVDYSFLTEDEIDWIRNSGLVFKIDEGQYEEVHTILNPKRVRYMKEAPKFRIITRSEKEETWLLLRFSDQVFLEKAESIF